MILTKNSATQEKTQFLRPSYASFHSQKQPPEAFFKKAALKNFTISIRKHLCWSRFLIKVEDGKEGWKLASEALKSLFNNMHRDPMLFTTVSWQQTVL